MRDVERQERNWRVRVTTWDVVGIVSFVGLVVSVTLLVLWFFELGK
jgi:hypothetical protein